MTLILLAIVLIHETPDCLAQLALTAYPPLALKARVRGTAELTFRVDANGYPFDVVASGHPLLAPSTARVTEGIVLDPALCGSQTFTVTYLYELGKSTEVSKIAPNVFRVTWHDEVIETTRDPVIYVSRLRSLARRLFRR